MHEINDIKILKQYFYLKNKGDSLQWNQLLLSNTCYPEHQEEAIELILTGLGYLPFAQVYSDYIPFIRTAIHQRKDGKISNEAFLNDITLTIMQIRNKQMVNEKRIRTFENDDFEVYYRVATNFKNKARRLLLDILGFEIKLEHSLEAELILRLSFMADSSIEFMDFDSVTYYAATIAYYRYNYLRFGLDVADETPLLGLIIPRKRNLAQA